MEMTARAKPAQVSSRSYFKFLENRIRSKDERTLDVSAPSSSSHVSIDAARLLAGLQLIAEERKRQEKGQRVRQGL